MALKIIKASEPISVDRINIVLYGPPGVGKSSLGFTAAAPLMLDFDMGSHRAANRKDSVRVERWSDIADLSAADLADYSTVLVDTAGRALDALTVDIIKREPKMGRGGVLTIQGYGKLKGEFVSWLKLLNSYGKDVVLIAHMDEQRNGDELIERLDVQGGSKGEIYKAADAMGRIAIRDGKRVLNFSPTDASFGKNPGNLPPLDVPHPDADGEFLAAVIKRTKDRLNAATVEQVAAQKAMSEWKARVDKMKTADDFNAALPDAKKAPKALQKLLADAAAAAGMAFDAKAAKYALKAAEAS